MQSTQSFVPFLDGLPSSRSTTSSIWAPQPQPSDSAWTKAIDTFSQGNFPGTFSRPDPRRLNSFPAFRTGEDVFGPLDHAGQPFKRDVGAIGDGRKKSASSPDDVHVEQLLRALNLNSPAPPFNQTHIDNVNLLSSPDSPGLSPISSTSAPLTPADLSPAKMLDVKMNPTYDFGTVYSAHDNALLFETGASHRFSDNVLPSHTAIYRSSQPAGSFHNEHPVIPFFEPLSENASTMASSHSFNNSTLPPFAHARAESSSLSPLLLSQHNYRTSSDWVKTDERQATDYTHSALSSDRMMQPVHSQTQAQAPAQGPVHAHEPINFLTLLHPSSTPPYHLFVARIIKSSDQQASIFLQQKLKVADTEERGKIVDAICAKGFEMMAHRFGNWAVQRCLEATASFEERHKIVACMRGRVVELATNCYGCHVLQKALDCEEDIRLVIVSELLLGDPAQTLVNKHASHVWSKIMELSWSHPAPPIFTYVNRSLKGKWASLACHETGSLVVQHAFENLEESAKDGIVDELLNQGAAVFGEVAKSQWGSYCIQHILEHGSPKHQGMALDHLLSGLLDYATNEQGVKSVTKALKEGGKDTLDKIIKRMCEPAKAGGRRAVIVDLALSVTGSQLIASVLPTADKDQRALLYDSIRGHIVTLRGCKTGSKVIWLFDRMRAYYGY